jgi:hypothetical protein
MRSTIVASFFRGFFGMYSGILQESFGKASGFPEGFPNTSRIHPEESEVKPRTNMVGILNAYRRHLRKNVENLPRKAEILTNWHS